MRRFWAAGVSLVVAAAGVMSGAGTAGSAPHRAPAAAAGCSTVWGSGAKSAENTEGKSLKNITTSRGKCYDRMVFEVGGAARSLGYRVGYVDAFRRDGSGDAMRVAGGAILQIFVSASSCDPNTLRQTYAGRAGKPLPGVDVTGYKTFRDARFGSSFEGRTQVGLGVRARLPFRVTQSHGKLVVDVAHTW
ncbi:hypothetical protein V1460_16275 [Streptomyces sp. SCSIO 30461]|uniref:AMIN-like domain-containing (lipo)protein n=1 Tax=Streptomyces sp. SCSIO 30461 TaxID=3118085 RepID=UPI0030D466EB